MHDLLNFDLKIIIRKVLQDLKCVLYNYKSTFNSFFSLDSSSGRKLIALLRNKSLADISS
jgi:hypothetical protein